VACVADDEGTDPGSWDVVRQKCACLRWDNHKCTEEVVFAIVPDELLLEIPRWAELIGSRERRHLIPDIRRALGDNVTQPESEWLSSFGRSAVLAAITRFAVPPRSSREKGWFKSIAGGRLLATKMLEIGANAPLRETLAVFLAAVRQATE
jgi:hypothetical protein